MTLVLPLSVQIFKKEIALFDKAYISFTHLYNLAQRGIFWVTGSKDNMSFTVRKKTHPKT
ncbi:MAG: hypothetical protein ACJAR1_002532 [Rubritalea sp.]|jgi:hypothetical protein